MSSILPLFPLQLVVFPGEQLNLHIFEPRYKQLIIECEKEGRSFGIPYVEDNKPKLIGTEVELVAIKKTYPDGKMDVSTLGKGKFKIQNFYKRLENRLYPGGEIERLDTDLNGDIVFYSKIRDMIAELYTFMHIDKDPPDLSEGFTCFDIAHKIGLASHQEYELLTMNSEELRQEYLINHLEKFIPAVKEMENLRKKIQMNGHFKNVIPPSL